MVIGHWLLVIGHWSLVIGHWLLVIGYWSLVIGHWLLVIGYWSLVIGHWSFSVGCWSLVKNKNFFPLLLLSCGGFKQDIVENGNGKFFKILSYCLFPEFLILYLEFRRSRSLYSAARWYIFELEMDN